MRKEATEGGYKIISTKWIDTNKGDDERPNYRSRLVGREIKRDKRLNLFAATPPLETLKFLIARCSQEQTRSNPWRFAVVDVRRAYFYAPAQRTIFIEIPVEDLNQSDNDKVGKRNLSLYGTQDAAMNWAAEYSNCLKSVGLCQGSSSPLNFSHREKNLNVTVHGDDFAVTGPLNSVKWFQATMEKKYDTPKPLGRRWAASRR